MSYASFHIDKVNSSLNSIGKHIERTSQPDNVDPTRTHLNRNDIVEFPEGVHSFAEAVEHRIATAGLRRKVGKNQVRCMTFIMSSDHDAMKRIEAEGRLDEWVDVSMRWAKDTFGKENVVGASLHMDEYTPHLHLVVVPITTTERKKKPRESKAKKRYRTQPKNAPRLSADDIMTRENLTRFQDTYAEAMARFGLERGIRGSEARHVDQHEYYRQCQIKKKVLEQDVATLSSEKRQLDTETKSLEKRKKELERGNRYMDKAFADTKAANAEMIRQNGELEKRKSELEKSNSFLTAANTSLTTEKEALEADRKKKADEIAAIEADKSRLIAERTTCAKEAETARKEKETALQEAAEAKSQRDANRKDALSNLANRFTGSKTKKLESELAQSREEVKTLKEQAEQTSKTHSNEMWNLRQQLDRQIEREKSIVRGHNDVIAKIERYFPDTIAMIPALEECEQVGIPDSFARKLMDGGGRYLGNNVTLDYPEKREKIEVVTGTTFKFIRDPSDNKFHLHINGTRIFQWLKEQWQSLKQSVKRGFGIR